MRNATIADLVVAIAPSMEELIELRAEVQRLRFKANPPTEGLAESLKDTPFRLEREVDGRWRFAISGIFGPSDTGGHGFETDLEAFKAALRHSVACAASLQAELDELCREDGP